ncbi:TIR domain-containing protein [Pseudomonas fluorescens]|uniref:TIR domain-containing protein n=1 Tax=Pseudomonas fluorescens TaxID=294 RepID=A0A5E7VTY8_PSEFL|nr:TIR domain-containing protein [Pseudomonas fluorescens]VVQ26359.1 hypothetical protein PS928_06521 [Pseudomonas fluorescens]
MVKKSTKAFDRNAATALFGYDIFVSFALGPSPRGTQSYASDLVRQLRERNLTVFYSEDQIVPGDQLTRTLKLAIKRSRILVVVLNKATLERPGWVREEVTWFREINLSRPVVPIDIGNALKNQTGSESISWLGEHDIIWIDEREDAAQTGLASNDVVERIVKVPLKTRAALKWRRFLFLTAVMLIGLTVASLWAGMYAREKASLAFAEVKVSSAQRLLAESSARENSISANHAEDVNRVLIAYDIFPHADTLGALQRTWDHREHTWLGTLLSVGEQEEKASISSIAFSPKGDALAWSSTDGVVTEYDLNLRRAQLKEPPKVTDAGGVFIRAPLYIQYSEDGEELLAVGDVNKIFGLCFWQRGNTRLKFDVSLEYEGRDIIGVQRGAAGIGLALERGGPLVRLQVDVKGKTYTSTPLALTIPEDLTVVAFSHDLSKIVGRGSSGSVYFWDRNSGLTPIRLLSHPASTDGSFSMESVAMAAGGDSLAYSDGPKLKIYRPVSGKTKTVGITGYGEIAFSPSGKVIGLGGSDGAIKTWDMDTFQELTNIPHAHQDSITAIALSNDGQIASGDSNGELRIWRQVEDKVPQWRVSGHVNKENLGGTYSGGFWKPSPWKEGIRDLAVSVDGTKVASAGGDGVIFIWDLKQAKAVAKYAAHAGSVNSLAWFGHPDRLLSGSSDGFAKIWSPAGQPPSLPELVGDSNGESVLVKVSVTKAGEIVTFSRRGEIRWFDPISLKETKRCDVPFRSRGERYVTAFAISHSGTLAAVADYDRNLWMFDPRDCSHSTALLDPGPGIESDSPDVEDLAFVPDKELLVAVGRRQYPDRAWLGIYSRDTTQVIRKVVASSPKFVSVASDRSGRFIGVASATEIRLFDTMSNSWVGSPFGTPEDNIVLQRIAFLPDNKAIVVGQSDGSLREWPILTGWYDRLCENLQRAPTASDWTNMLPGFMEEFHSGCVNE